MPATNRTKFLKSYGLPLDSDLSLKELAQISGDPIDALKEVWDRGMGAWRTNPSSVRLRETYAKNPNLSQYPRSSRLSPQQWAFGRVYSFLQRSKTVFYGADRDIAERYGLLTGGGVKTIRDQLKALRIRDRSYLYSARMSAKENGYDPNAVFLSDKPEFKLMYKTPDGSYRYFGRVGYGDFHIYSMLERRGMVDDGTAMKKQDTFIKSHSAIKGNWKRDPYSPNNLAIWILWS